MLDSRQLGARARYTYVGCLAGLHRWMETAGVREEDPTDAVVRPKLPRRLPRPAPTADLVLALERAPARMRAWLCLAAYAGLRCKEIAGLRVEDVRVDRDPPVLHLRDTKGDHDRVVPLGDEVWAALEHHGLPVTGYVFPALDRAGRPTKNVLRPNYVSAEVSKYLHGIGIAATAHQLRHWFGTTLYQRTRDLKLVAELMGHAKIETTSLYVALIPTDEAVEAVRTLRAE